MIIEKLDLINYLIGKLQNKFGAGCKKHYVALSGGVDSSLVVVLLCLAFGPENVVAVYRNINSSPIHWQHAQLLQKKFGFILMKIDGNDCEQNLIDQLIPQFKENKLKWYSIEERPDVYASERSRFNTWIGGLISKMADLTGGRIYGTGNGEEDYLFYFFDKFGDGAVDNNILAGLNKAEVRQLALYLGVPREIVIKTPSDDLSSHLKTNNDEEQLTAKARSMGYDIEISYGAPDGSEEGNGAWAWREDIKHNWFFRNTQPTWPQLKHCGYSEDQVRLILFLFHLRKLNSHKVLNIPGTDRKVMMELGLID